MAPQHPKMTMLQTFEGHILTDADDIAQAGSHYYATLFRPNDDNRTPHSNPCDDDALTRQLQAEELELQEWLQREWDY